MDLTEIRSLLGDVKDGLHSVSALQRTMAEQHRVMAEQQRVLAEQQRVLAENQEQTSEALGNLTRRFDTFLIRFDETLEMLVRHDTEQLQRVTAVERENAALRDVVEQLTRRIDSVERRLAS